MGTHKHHHEKDHPHEPNKKTADDLEDSQTSEHLDGKKSTHAEAKKTTAEPATEIKNVTITNVEFEKLKSEAAEFKDKYLRVLAESENARKRLQKEKQEMIQYALQNVIVDFLNPIDHMENALKYTQQMSEEVKHWAVGFQMILTQFKDVLANNGVEPFNSEGKPFDPHFHEAVEVTITRDFPPNTVIDESVKGYKMGEKVIRPARVKVTKAPSDENEINENETIEQSK